MVISFCQVKTRQMIIRKQKKILKCRKISAFFFGCFEVYYSKMALEFLKFSRVKLKFHALAFCNKPYLFEI